MSASYARDYRFPASERYYKLRKKRNVRLYSGRQKRPSRECRVPRGPWHAFPGHVIIVIVTIIIIIVVIVSVCSRLTCRENTSYITITLS
ncbi:hypothetical protein X777_08848 [Ooceraea biroi]|uniref:Uncharacterized protein n=1 Tax=Ooceraea biroi TaxID=2015173 RepID=A0A026W9H4_OOCBI|nr:hypothetical protein X777_08848 [Ooceraea biroi]